jgi:NAD-dependent deacetylase
VTDRSATVAGWLSEADLVMVLTGAGISTESGIADYRGPNGIWTKDPGAARMMQIDVYLADPEVRQRGWLERMHHPAWTARPNEGHVALAEIQRSTRRFVLATQNIDGLHQAAGSTDVLELHGTMHLCRCLGCGYETPMLAQLDRVRAGESDPACERCGGIQRSATVAFGQPLDEEVLLSAFESADACWLFIAVGTSLVVSPASQLCGVAARSGARVVIVNAEPTPYDDVADVIFRDPIGQVLPEIVRQMKEQVHGG